MAVLYLREDKLSTNLGWETDCDGASWELSQIFVPTKLVAAPFKLIISGWLEVPT